MSIDWNKAFGVTPKTDAERRVQDIANIRDGGRRRPNWVAKDDRREYSPIENTTPAVVTVSTFRQCSECGAVGTVGRYPFTTPSEQEMCTCDECALTETEEK